MRIIFSLCLLLSTLSPTFSQVNFDERSLKNGIKAWHVEDHTLPIIALELRFKGGELLDRVGKEGSVRFMTSLLEEGAGELDYRQFSEKSESLAAYFQFRSGANQVSISAIFLSENRDDVVALLADALNEPRFDAGPFERVRGQLLGHIADQADYKFALLDKAWSEAAYPNHPLSRDGGGTVETISALTRDDIHIAYRDAMALDNLVVGVSGDITEQELSVMLEQLFHKLPKHSQPAPEPMEPKLTAERLHVDVDTVQSSVRITAKGILRDDPDYMTMMILNEILGGRRFNTRLMEALRENNGLTYGVQSYVVDTTYSHYLISQFDTREAQVDRAIEVFRDVWQQIGEHGVTQQELDAARNYMIGSYALRFDSNENIAAALVGLQLMDLPVDYISTRRHKLESITLDDMNRVARRMYKADALNIMVAGRE